MCAVIVSRGDEGRVVIRFAFEGRLPVLMSSNLPNCQGLFIIFLDRSLRRAAWLRSWPCHASPAQPMGRVILEKLATMVQDVRAIWTVLPSISS